MTHYIQHQYDELLPAAWPGLEIHVVYDCESEIWVDNGSEQDPTLTYIRASVNGTPVQIPAFPREQDGQSAREFLAKLRESARQALWATALREAKAAGYADPLEISTAAQRWISIGEAELPMPAKDWVA